MLASHVTPHTHTPPLVNIQAAERVDYYALLGVERDADAGEITRAWRRLVLLHHPDKQPASGPSEAGSDVSSQQHQVDIRLVNEARWVLSDTGRRREWEEAFFDGRGEVPVPTDNIPHISHHHSLEDFTPHYASSVTRNHNRTAQCEHPDTDADISAEDDQDPSYYTHPCRCSGEFVITHQDLEDGVEVVGCEGCGEWVRVGYEIVEDGEDAEE